MNFHYHNYCRCSPGGSYHSLDDPEDAWPPDYPWSETGPHGVPFPPNPGGSVWVSKRNLYVSENQKEWTVEVTGNSADKYGARNPTGYDDGDPPQTVPIGVTTGARDEPGPPKKRIFTFTFRPQPEWEKVELVRTSKARDDGNLYMHVRSYSICSYVGQMEDRLDMLDLRFGVDGEDSSRITAIYLFPESVPIDPVGFHPIDAPPDSGMWFSEPVYVDPMGLERPLGGVRWWTDGEGLLPFHVCSLSMELMEGRAGNRYEMFAFDNIAGDFQTYDIEVIEVAVPTVSLWGLVLMVLLMATTGTVLFRRRAYAALAPSTAS